MINIGTIMKKSLNVLFIALSLVGCANNDLYSGDVYSSQEATQVQTVRYGTITGLRPVEVQNTDDGNNLVGTVSGALVGGLIGNTIGHGTGRTLATTAGALAGGAAGQGITEKINRAHGVQLEVHLDNGTTIAVVQTVKNSRFSVGQRVRITSSGSRVTVSPL